jgi:hypothetical protein
MDKHYQTWSRGLDEKFAHEGHAPHDAATRLVQDDYVDISFSPRFKIPSDAKYFAIGSCFARNIEAALKKDGNRILSMELEVPEEIRSWIFHFENELLTKFTPHSMEVELERAFTDVPIDTGFIELNPPQVWNPQLHRGRQASYEVQCNIAEAVRTTVRKIADADVIFITLGLTETWWDKETETPLNDAPVDWRYAKRTGRFEFRNSTYEDCKNSVERMLDIITKHSNVPSPKVILTVSPVPLLRTFSEMDIVVANSYSKSVLRGVADEMRRKYDFVDYFPSYEMVNFTPRHLAWRHDQRHVQQEMVWSITGRFRDAYVEQD